VKEKHWIGALRGKREPFQLRTQLLKRLGKNGEAEQSERAQTCLSRMEIKRGAWGAGSLHWPLCPAHGMSLEAGVMLGVCHWGEPCDGGVDRFRMKIWPRGMDATNWFMLCPFWFATLYKGNFLLASVKFMRFPATAYGCATNPYLTLPIDTYCSSQAMMFTRLIVCSTNPNLSHPKLIKLNQICPGWAVHADIRLHIHLDIRLDIGKITDVRVELSVQPRISTVNFAHGFL